MDLLATLTGRGLTGLTVAFLLVLIGMLVADGIARNVFLSGRVGSAEWMGLVFCGMMCAALPLNIHDGPHIEVDVLYRVVPDAVKTIMNAVRSVAIVTVFVVMLPYAWTWGSQSVAIRESRFGVVTVPIYPFKVGFVVALAMCAIIAIGQLARQVRGPLSSQGSS
jgi:TRAP-type C4-dicarboxylate transport system permease small subunit